MSFLNINFYIFFIFFFLIYYFVPKKYKYIVIFIGSFIFYGYANPKMLLALMGITIISYIGGLAIDKWHNRLSYLIPLITEIFVLVIFKYLTFFIDSINTIFSKLSLDTHLNINWDIILPVGLSFIIFQSCNYLHEVYKGKIKTEKNIIKYSSFVAFFPTVLSGPIQKARNILPQISKPKDFNYDDAKEGTIIFLWGLFQKILIANKLSAISLSILNNYTNKSSIELLIGAVAFSFYIYADFSSYSDMAFGISKILGIDVGKNFNNPYLSKSTSEFWNRWHISLNEWFIENVYIPLGGNRKGRSRKYMNMMIVFLISGLWHGSSWHFVIWGLLNGLLVIIGQITSPLKSKLYSKLKIDENKKVVVLFKRCIVFILITITWLFFIENVTPAIDIIKKIFEFDSSNFVFKEMLKICGTYIETIILGLTFLLFCFVQCKRNNEDKIFKSIAKRPLFIQCLLLSLLISMIIFAAFSTTANVDSNFLYFNF